MKVSIVVCTRNRADSLRETIASIGRCQIPAHLSVELLVVDNGSSDHTREVVDELLLANVPIRYVLESRPGKGFAYNTGMAEAAGEMFLFTDDDVRVPENWIEGMCNSIVAGEADALTGAIVMADHLKQGWMDTMHDSYLACVDSVEADAEIFLIGANMAFSRKVLESVGGFDPELGPGAKGHADDTLLTLQIKEAAFRVAFVESVAVEHHFDAGRLSRSSLAKQAQKRGEFNAYVAHHWFHAYWRLPLLKMLREWVRLQLSRLLHLREWLSHPSSPGWELQLLEGFYTFSEYRKERKRPRNYDRHGLKKLRDAD